MRTTVRLPLAAILGCLALLGGTQGASADCAGLLADFDKAVAAKSIVDAKKAEKGILTDIACFSNAARIRKQRIEFQLAMVDDPSGPLTTDAQKEAALVDAATPIESWRAAAKLADFRMMQRNFRLATTFYGEAIRRAMDKGITTTALTDTQTSQLMKRASAAKAFAMDDAQGTKSIEPLPTIRDVDGSIGGVYALRGVKPVAVPVPINFTFGTAKFTPLGEQMAKELANVLLEQKPTEITLIGHTDPVGSDEYNLALSDQRVRAVAKYLGEQGVSVSVKLVAKGKREPFDVSSLPIQPSKEDAYALDRRVELLR